MQKNKFMFKFGVYLFLILLLAYFSRTSLTELTEESFVIDSTSLNDAGMSVEEARELGHVSADYVTWKGMMSVVNPLFEFLISFSFLLWCITIMLDDKEFIKHIDNKVGEWLK